MAVAILPCAARSEIDDLLRRRLRALAAYASRRGCAGRSTCVCVFADSTRWRVRRGARADARSRARGNLQNGQFRHGGLACASLDGLCLSAPEPYRLAGGRCRVRSWRLRGNRLRVAPLPVLMGRHAGGDDTRSGIHRGQRLERVHDRRCSSSPTCSAAACTKRLPSAWLPHSWLSAKRGAVWLRGVCKRCKRASIRNCCSTCSMPCGERMKAIRRAPSNCSTSWSPSCARRCRACSTLRRACRARPRWHALARVCTRWPARPTSA